MRSLLLIAIVVTSAIGAADLRAAGVAARCRGTQLTGRFTVVAGSAGAGNIVYALVLGISPPGGGTTTAPISPPTAVCEHGLMSFSAYGR
jgi:hypothetical protein